MRTFIHSHTGLEQTYPTRMMWHMWVFLILVVLCSAGCSRYEDQYSGSYWEVPDPTRPSNERMVVDLFRFGNYTKAIIRVFKQRQPNEPPQEILCEWTSEGEAPGDARKIELSVPPNEYFLSGDFVSDTRMKLNVTHNGVTNEKFFEFAGAPSNRCTRKGSFYVDFDFDLGPSKPNIFPDYVANKLRRPVLVIQWVNFASQGEQEGLLVPTGGTSTAVQLPEFNIRRDGRGLEDTVLLKLSAPREALLAPSGRTRIGLGHFLVVEDTTPTNTFDWNAAADPIVASSLQIGTEIQNPFPEAEGFGKALLYVEGSLSDIPASARKNSFINADKMIEDWNQEHFYIVDVFFDRGEAVGVRFPSDPSILGRPAYNKVKLQVTDRYLSTTQTALPRLRPFTINPRL